VRVTISANPLVGQANIVLQPKYWCKHCGTYVKDTTFERKQHESTGKHQGNLRRFLQGIQNDHAKNEREKDKAKAEIERLNRIAGPTSGPESSSTASSSTTSAFTRSSKPSTQSLSAADQKRQWAQLAEMGIPIPEQSRAEMAMAGDWQTISRKVEPDTKELLNDKLNVGVRKREHEHDEEIEEAGEPVTRKGWGSTIRTYPGQTPVDNSLDALLSVPLVKKEKQVKEPPPDQVKPGFASRTPNTEPCSIKSETSHTANMEQLDLQDQESQNVHTTSRRASEIKNETLETSTKTQDQQEFVPVFKKRRVKQPPATKT